MGTPLNLSQYGRDLNDAYQKVLDPKSSIDWVLTGYLGRDTLKVNKMGSGLDDLTDEFSDGKIQYAFARVVDDISGLPKFVFIGWCGEGVPDKGIFATHNAEVQRFFKGAHVTINARHDADVDPANIKKKVRDASGAKYSIHNEVAKPELPPEPVGSVYKKTVVDIPKASKVEPPPEPVGSAYQPVSKTLPEPKPISGNRFATSAASQTDKRVAEERAKREQADREAREREASKASAAAPAEARASSGEDARKAREAELEALRKARSSADDAELAAMTRARQGALDTEAEEEQRRREEARKGRAEEEENRRQEEEDRRRRDDEARRQREEEDAARRKREEEARKRDAEERARKDAEDRARREADERKRQEEEDRRAAAARVAAPPPAAASGGITAKAIYDYEKAEDNEISFADGELITSIEKVDEGWWKGKNAAGEASERAIAVAWKVTYVFTSVQIGLFPSTYVEEVAAAVTASYAPPPVAAAVAAPPAPARAAGIVADAVFDYEAQESNEISFADGEVITDIEKIDEGWWKGKNARGEIGLFPANYVEER
ncbi:hypothetical protein DFJ74DRAFT_605593 [Hyaloraphidium curvatum]|nr:hypothetical protein DFJ74DRAFT_605593 [Hyaloraphidium curvatum]